MIRSRREQEGMVSFMAVIFIALLLSILSLGIASLSRDEARSATDYYLQTKADFAAYSGVEDVLWDQVKNGGASFDQSCTQNVVEPGPVGPNSDTEYTCAFIDTSRNYLLDTVYPNQAVYFDLSDTNGIASIQLDWHRTGTDAPTNVNYSSSTTYSDPGQNPQSFADPAYPPIARISVVEWPDSGLHRDDIQQRVFLARPGDSSSSTTSVGYTSVSSGYDSTASDQGNYQCTDTREYACSIRITGLSGGNYFLQVSMFYEYSTGTGVRLSAYDSSGTQIDINPDRVIDVTARSGPDVYSRFRYELPDNGKPVAALLLPFALYSDSTICKNFRVDIVNDKAISDPGKDAEDGCN